MFSMQYHFPLLIFTIPTYKNLSLFNKLMEKNKSSTSKIIIIILLVIFVLFIFVRIIKQPTNNFSQPEQDITGEWVYPKTNSDNAVWGIGYGIGIGIPGSEWDYGPWGNGAPGRIQTYRIDTNGDIYLFNYIGVGILNKLQYDDPEMEKIQLYPENPSFLEELKQIQNTYSETDKEYIDFIDLTKNPPTQLSQAKTIQGNKMTLIFRHSQSEKNKAMIAMEITFDKTKPKEIEIELHNLLPKTHSEDLLHLDASWGNLGRIRELYLKNEIINANDLYSDEQLDSSCFYPIKKFEFNTLPISSDGSITIYAGNDEENYVGMQVHGGPEVPYGRDGQKFYQYWKKYPGTYTQSLSVIVNGRDNQFAGFKNACGSSSTNFLGGTSYENFDMFEDHWYEGQTFWFGYSYEKN